MRSSREQERQRGLALDRIKLAFEVLLLGSLRKGLEQRRHDLQLGLLLDRTHTLGESENDNFCRCGDESSDEYCSITDGSGGYCYADLKQCQADKHRFRAVAVHAVHDGHAGAAAGGRAGVPRQRARPPYDTWQASLSRARKGEAWLGVAREGRHARLWRAILERGRRAVWPGSV